MYRLFACVYAGVHCTHTRVMAASTWNSAIRRLHVQLNRVQVYGNLNDHLHSTVHRLLHGEAAITRTLFVMSWSTSYGARTRSCEANWLPGNAKPASKSPSCVASFRKKTSRSPPGSTKPSARTCCSLTFRSGSWNFPPARQSHHRSHSPERRCTTSLRPYNGPGGHSGGDRSSTLQLLD